MSEPHDISEASTVPAMPAVPAGTAPAGFPLDFGPLLDQDTEDFDFTPPPPAYQPRKRRTWLTLLIVGLLVVLLGGTILAYRLLTRPPAIQYTQAAATIGNLTVTVSGTGPVQAGAIYNLNFSASAPIQTIDVQVGQHVNQGQVLATLNPTTLQDAVNQAQNGVDAAQTAVNNAQTGLNNTQNQQNTAIDIAKINEQNGLNSCKATGSPASGSGGGSSNGGAGPASPTPTPNPTTVANCEKLVTDQYNQAVDQANSAIANAQNQLASAQQQLTNAQTSLQTAKDNLANATLVAPHAGVIESINGLVGENAGGGGSSGSGGASGSSGSGSSGSSAFIVLVDASTLNIAAQINEANIASVAVNQPAQFTVPAYPSQTFHASVTSIDTLGQTSSSVVTFLVNLAVDMQSIGSLHVYPGMTATVNITTAERISTLLVPSSALSFAATALQNGELDRSSLSSLIGGATKTGSGNRGIVVELKNDKLVPVLVTTGLTNGQQTEILSGLQEGDQVVIGQTGGTTSTGNSNTNTRGIFGGGNRGGGNFGGGGN